MKNNQPENDYSDFQAKLSRPARQALAEAGFTRLEQLITISEAQLKKLHGMGPKVIGQLRQALDNNGLSFAEGKPRKD